MVDKTVSVPTYQD